MRSLLVIAQTGFQDVELKGTRDGLVAGGFTVELASTEIGPCSGKFGSVEQATIALRDVKVADYNRIGFIGGPGAGALADDPDAQALAQATVKAKKPLGAICIAPTILAKAGVLRGVRATVWDDGEGTQISLLKECGAEYTGESVTVDGLIVTGNGPKAAVEFGKTFARIKN